MRRREKLLQATYTRNPPLNLILGADATKLVRLSATPCWDIEWNGWIKVYLAPAWYIFCGVYVQICGVTLHLYGNNNHVLFSLRDTTIKLGEQIDSQSEFSIGEWETFVLKRTCYLYEIADNVLWLFFRFSSPNILYLSLPDVYVFFCFNPMASIWFYCWCHFECI